MTDTTTKPSTCPDWCTEPLSHGYDIETATGLPTRFHERIIERGDGFTVWLAAREWVTGIGRGFVLGAITVGCDSGSFDEMSALPPARARDLAAALVRAADEAARIEAQR